VNAPKPNNIREWFAYFGGEESGMSLEIASRIWDAAIESMTYRTENQKVCTWEWDECCDTYETTCGKSWILLEGDCRENDVKYCHNCGLPVKEDRSVDTDDVPEENTTI
jgi:hypothetical protein